MGITVQHEPSYGLIGQAAYASGTGDYRKYLEALRLQELQFMENQRQFNTGVANQRDLAAFQAQQNRIGQMADIAARQQSQAFDTMARERQMGFQHLSGLQQAQQQAALGAMGRQQQFGYQDYLNRQGYAADLDRMQQGYDLQQQGYEQRDLRQMMMDSIKAPLQPQLPPGMTLTPEGQQQLAALQHKQRAILSQIGNRITLEQAQGAMEQLREELASLPTEPQRSWQEQLQEGFARLPDFPGWGFLQVPDGKGGTKPLPVRDYIAFEAFKQQTSQAENQAKAQQEQAKVQREFVSTYLKAKQGAFKMLNDEWSRKTQMFPNMQFPMPEEQEVEDLARKMLGPQFDSQFFVGPQLPPGEQAMQPPGPGYFPGGPSPAVQPGMVQPQQPAQAPQPMPGGQAPVQQQAVALLDSIMQQATPDPSLPAVTQQAQQEMLAAVKVYRDLIAQFGPEFAQWPPEAQNAFNQIRPQLAPLFMGGQQ